MMGLSRALDALEKLTVKSQLLLEVRAYVLSDEYKLCQCKRAISHVHAYYYGRGDKMNDRLLPLSYIDEDGIYGPY